MKSGTARSGQRRFCSIKKGQVLFLCKEEGVSVFLCKTGLLFFTETLDG